MPRRSSRGRSSRQQRRGGGGGGGARGGGGSGGGPFIVHEELLRDMVIDVGTSIPGMGDDDDWRGDMNNNAYRQLGPDSSVVTDPVSVPFSRDCDEGGELEWTNSNSIRAAVRTINEITAKDNGGTPAVLMSIKFDDVVDDEHYFRSVTGAFFYDGGALFRAAAEDVKDIVDSMETFGSVNGIETFVGLEGAFQTDGYV